MVVLEVKKQKLSSVLCPAQEHKADREIMFETEKQNSSSLLCPTDTRAQD